MFFWNKNKSTSGTPKGAKDIDVQWGGYYATKTHEGFVVTRLLDFYQSSYHVQQFQEVFTKLPSLDEVKALKPTALDAQAVTKDIMGSNQTLIGGAPLNEEDVAGYEAYLLEHGYEQTEIDAIKERIILFSQSGPTKVRLALNNGVFSATLLR